MKNSTRLAGWGMRVLPVMAVLSCLLFHPENGFGQTNPTAQSLPFSQNFGTTTFNSMPAGMAAWNGLDGGTINTQTLAEGSTPSGNATVTATAAVQTGGGTYGYAVSSNARPYVQTSSNATNGVNQLALAVNTTGLNGIQVAYDVEIISAQPRTVGIVMQYRVGTSGSWTTVSATGNPYSQANGTTGVKANVLLTLPAAANNQSVVQIRWATWRGTETGNSSGIAIDNVAVSGSNCTAPAITTPVSSNSPIYSNQTLNLSVAASGSPLNYAWSGTGSFTNPTTATPTVSGAATGFYSVVISNGCGSTSSSAAVFVGIIPPNAANLTKLEWFFDTDPGIGLADAGHTVALSGTQQSVDVVASTTGLTTGFHYFNARAQDADGKWSETHRRVIYIPASGAVVPPAANLTKLEWFFDTDPGIGLADAAHTVALSGTQSSIDVTAAVAGLSVGFHYFNTRAQDANGSWSETHRRVIYIPASGAAVPPAANLTKLEWFFDTDPGIGLADGNHTVVLSGTQQMLDVTAPVAGLSVGFHYFNLRAQDANGKWSETHRRVIYIPASGAAVPPAANLTKLEWFFDTDPGIGQADAAHTVALSGTQTSVDVTAAVAGLTTGFHYFNTRAQDANGSWSETHRRVIYMPAAGPAVPAATNITQIEYFWDGNDPGFGLATQVTGFTPSTNLVNQPIDVCVSGLLVGSHTFHLRAKNAAGSWSETAPKTLNLTSVPCSDSSPCTLDYGDPTQCGVCLHAPAQPPSPGVADKSVNLNGISQYISTPTNTLSGTGAFTVECWVRSSESRSNSTYWNRKTILGNSTTGTGSGDLGIFLEEGHPGFWSGLAGAADFDFTATERTFEDNAWHHVALQRTASGLLSFYVDGLLERTFPGNTNALNLSTTPFFIGAQNASGTANYFAGCNVDEVRFSNVARYSGTYFTPNTTPFSSDANTKLLFHLDETSGVTATDASSNGNNGTLTNAPARLAVQTFPPSGSGAIGFDGIDDYMATPASVLNGLNNWTIEFWVKTDEDRTHATNYLRRHLIGNASLGGGSGDFGIYTQGGLLGMECGTTGNGSDADFLSSAVLSNHTWHHVAASSNGSLIRLFLDGALLGSVSGVGNLITNALPFWVGSSNTCSSCGGGAQNHGGTFDEIRFSNIARYTTAFSTPTTTFSNDANTVLLWHLDQDPCSTTTNTPDASGHNLDGTFVGNPTRAISDVPLQSVCNSPATTNAGPDQTICIINGNETVQLAGVMGGAASSVTWTGGAGSFSPNNHALNAIYTPTAAEIAANGVTLTLTTNDPDDFGPCLAAVDQVALNLNSVDAGVVTGGGQTICSGGDPTAFGQTTAPSGSAGGAIQIQWQKSTTDCNTGFSDIAGATAAIYDPPAGLTTTTFYRRKTTSTFGGGSCVDYSNCLTVNVLANPTASIQSSVPIVCNGALGSFTIAASGGTGPYQFAKCTGGGCTNFGANQPTGFFGSLSPNTYVFRVTDANGCTGTISGTVVQFTATVVSTAEPLCFGGTDGDATLTSTNGTAPFSWNLGGGLTNSTGIFTDVLAAGSYVATVTDANSCATTVGFSIGQPTVLNGTATVTHLVDCTGPNTGHITAAGSGGTPNYQYKLDGGAFQASPNFNSVSAGSHVLTIRDANLCLKTVNFTMNSYQIGISGNSVICTGASQTLTATANFNPTNYWWSTDATTASIVVNPPISTTYTVTISAPEGCEMIASLEVTPTPAISNAGPDQTFCADPPTSVQLAGSIGGVATIGTWSGGAGSFSPNNTTLTALYTPTMAERSAGSVTLTLTTDDPDGAGPCQAASDAMIIFINAVPTTANAGPNQTICLTYSAALAANQPMNGIGTWSVTSGPSMAASQFSNVNFNNASFTPNGGSGTYTLRWTIANAPCPSNFSEMQVLVTPAPTTASAGPNQTICSTSPAFLAANQPTDGTGSWSIVSGPSSALSQFSDISNPFSTFTAAGGAGVYLLRWTISNPPCPASESVVSISVNAPSSNSSAGPNQTICFSEIATLAANQPTVGTGQWSVLSGPSTASNQFSNVNFNNSMFTPSGGAGVYTLKWSIENAPCTPSNSTMILTVSPLSVGGAVTSNQTICSGNSPNLLNLSGQTGVVQRWESSLDGLAWTPISNTATSFSPPALTTTTQFRAVVKSGVCAEASSTAATISVLENTTAAISIAVSPNTQICAGMTADFTATIENSGSNPIFQWKKNGSAVGMNSPNFSSSTLSTGDVIICELTTSLLCATPTTSVSNSITMTVATQPCVTMNVIPQTCTTDGPTTLVGYPSGGVFSGAGVSGNQFFPNTAGPGVHTISYTYDFGGGNVATFSQNATVVICVNCTLVASVSPTNPTAICSPSTVLLTASPNNASLFNFQWKRDGADISGATNSTYSATQSGVFTVKITEIANGCTSESSGVTVEILVQPEVSLLPYAPVCLSVAPFVLTGGQPLGGVFSGNGVSFSNGNYWFSPAVAGVGTHVISYTVTAQNGCTGMATRSIVVNGLPSVSLLPLAPMCRNDAPITLSGGSPSGGVFSGTGVSNGIFNPLAGVIGDNFITYTKTDGNGCSNSATQNLIVYPNPTVTLDNFPMICVNAAAFVLSGGLPSGAGGVYSGAGVSNNMFNPSVAGVGTHIITYTFTTTNGCSGTATNTILVNATPTVTLNPFSPVCLNGGSVSLSGGSPAGGSFSGTGVFFQNNQWLFDPLVAGVGVTTISYSFTNGAGCVSSASRPMTVNPNPNAPTLNPFNPVCLNSSSFVLTGGLPTGGTFSGPGVSGGMFNPATAGVGTHTIFYTVTNGFGCTASTSQTIVVNALPSVQLAPLAPICLNSSPFALTGGSPSGGIYSGPGIANGILNPSAAGVGTHSMSYVFTNNNGCTASAMISFIVRPLPNLFSMTGGGAFCAGGAGVAVGLSGSENGISYQLKNGSANVGSPQNGSGNALSFGNQTTAGSYSVVATNTSTGCTQNMSGAVSVVVNPLPNLFSMTGGGAFCAGGAGVAVGLSGSENGISYQLKNGSANVGSPQNGAGNPISFGNQTTAGSYSVVATNTSTGCTQNMTGAATVVVNPLPNLFSMTGGGAFCTGGAGVAVGLSGSQTGVSYQLKNGSNNVGSPQNGSGNPLSFGNQTAAGSYSVVATNTSTGCTQNMTGSVSVVVNPLPTVTLAPFSPICNNVDAIVLTGGSPSGGVFSGTGVSNGMFNPMVAGAGTHVISYTVTNENGCTATATRTILVNDCTVCSIQCPANRDVPINASCKITVPNLISEVVLTGNCVAPTNITQNPTAGTQVSKTHGQTQNVALSVTDGAGVTATCTVVLTAKDVTPPTVSCSLNGIQAVMTTDCKITIANFLSFVTAADLCGTATKAQSPTAGTILTATNNQTFVITFTATDAAGNTATTTKILTAKDQTPPTITTCPANRVVPLNAQCKLPVPNLTTELVATDGCSNPVSKIQNPTVGTLLSSTNGQVHTVVMTATDAAGNTKTCSVLLTGQGAGCANGGGGANLVGNLSNEINPTAYPSDKNVYEKLLELQAMPNPFSDELTVAFDLAEASKTRLILTDLTGKFLFFEKKNSLEAGRQIWTWNTEDLPEGAYLVGLKVENEGWRYRKVILVRR